MNIHQQRLSLCTPQSDGPLYVAELHGHGVTSSGVVNTLPWPVREPGVYRVPVAIHLSRQLCQL